MRKAASAEEKDAKKAASCLQMKKNSKGLVSVVAAKKNSKGLAAGDKDVRGREKSLYSTSFQ